MLSSSLHRFRIPLLWTLYAIAATATVVAVHHLYSTARREIAEQADRTLVEQRDRARDRIAARLDAIQRETMAELAGFHVDGLIRTLRQWDDANALVTGVFVWEPDHGYHRDSRFPADAPEPAGLLELWQTFRVWRTQHPNAVTAETATAGPFTTRALRTVENPVLPVAELGYQAENLDILAYAARPVDPWAGWAAPSGQPSGSWVFWYQAGPDAAVRGCFLDAAPIIAGLQEELGDHRLARLALTPLTRASVEGGAVRLESLPNHVLQASTGDLFAEKAAGVRLSALALATLLGLLLVGGAFLAVYSRREIRDAQRKTTFVSQVSHELRTPLTSIRMFGDMLAKPALSDDKRLRYAATISRESQRLGALVERLLAFNRLEAGRHAATFEAVDVAAVVRETLDDMDAVLREAGLVPVADLAESSMTVVTDRLALKQALINLLDNAAKYAAAGRSIDVALVCQPDHACIRVSDRGPGIPPHIRSRLFEPFVQGSSTLTDKPSGVGLGLSIARSLLRHAGGDLVLAPSGEGPGATFEIHLPLSRPTRS